MSATNTVTDSFKSAQTQEASVHAEESEEDHSEVLVEEDILAEPDGSYRAGDSIRASEAGGAASSSVEADTTTESATRSAAAMADEEERTKDSEACGNEEVTYKAAQEPVPVQVVQYEEDYDVEQRQTAGADSKTATTTSSDKCCGFTCCGYPNGTGQIIFAQTFLFFGLLLCTASLADCKCISATAGYPVPAIPNWDRFVGTVTQQDVNNITAWWEDQPPTRRGFGFVFNETLDGGCGFDEDSRYWIEEEFTNYQDFLGSDWNIPRALAGTAISIGWLLFLWSLTLACCSFARPFRWLAFFIIFFIMISFQASSFAIVGSDFCDEQYQWEVESTTQYTTANCSLARGAWLAIAGVGCYLISAILFLCMSNHVV